MIAEGDPDLMIKFARMAIYDFNFRILALKKGNAQSSNSLENEPFGLKG